MGLQLRISPHSSLKLSIEIELLFTMKRHTVVDFDLVGQFKDAI